MKPEQQRIKIAEACGWSDFHVEGGEPYGFEPGVIPDDEDPTLALNATWLPDYLNDLKAMHEAEKVLKFSDDTEDTWFEYLSQLYYIAGHGCCNDEQNNFRMVTANAEERAEAFLKTLGLWEDDDES